MAIVALWADGFFAAVSGVGFCATHSGPRTSIPAECVYIDILEWTRPPRVEIIKAKATFRDYTHMHCYSELLALTLYPRSYTRMKGHIEKSTYEHICHARTLHLFFENNHHLIWKGAAIYPQICASTAPPRRHVCAAEFLRTYGRGLAGVWSGFRSAYSQHNFYARWIDVTNSNVMVGATLIKRILREKSCVQCCKEYGFFPVIYQI